MNYELTYWIYVLYTISLYVVLYNECHCRCNKMLGQMNQTEIRWEKIEESYWWRYSVETNNRMLWFFWDLYMDGNTGIFKYKLYELWDTACIFRILQQFKMIVFSLLWFLEIKNWGTCNNSEFHLSPHIPKSWIRNINWVVCRCFVNSYKIAFIFSTCGGPP